MKLNIVTGFFLPVPPLRGGSTEKIWYRLSRELAARGHQITFISRRWPTLPNQEVVDGVTHVRLRGVDHSGSLVRNLWHDLWWGVRVARSLPPADVTICNTVTLPVWLNRVLPSAGRVAAVIARMPKGHGRWYGRVDLLLSLSGAASAALARENPKLVPRIAPFPFPIDWTLHARAATTVRKEVRPPAPLTIGYVGRVHPEKGLNLLLRGAARLAEQNDLPPWRILVVGPSAVTQGGGGETYQQSLQDEFGPRLGGRLVFAGPEFDVEALARRYAETDIFCYPSLAEAGETFGVAIAEAMAARCAPVVSRLTCFSELITPEETGLVFDHQASDPDLRLAGALRRLIIDSELRARIANQAQAHAQHYDFPEIARIVQETLAALIGQPQDKFFDTQRVGV